MLPDHTPREGGRVEPTPTSPRDTRRSDRGTVPVVALHHLTKRFGTALAVDGLDVELTAGSITGFLGPNGAGKTTTFRLLLGLASPTSGEALLFGRPYRELANPTRHVGALLESSDVDPGRSGRNHLRVLALAAGVEVARVDELLELVELGDAAHRPAGTYSLGMQQRLGLAAALLGDPELLVLDEPANGLDAAGVHWLRGFLRQYVTSGGTVFISSHLLAEVAQTVDQALIIDRGRLVATVSMRDMTDSASLERLYLDLTDKDEA
ncbi:MAG: ATP-binding cassette domain-containing protein [Nocardioides sp.]|nr:ATP-binding cassette domain-containing protein [Nocardioides sp.]